MDQLLLNNCCYKIPIERSDVMNPLDKDEHIMVDTVVFWRLSKLLIEDEYTAVSCINLNIDTEIFR